MKEKATCHTGAAGNRNPKSACTILDFSPHLSLSLSFSCFLSLSFLVFFFSLSLSLSLFLLVLYEFLSFSLSFLLSLSLSPLSSLSLSLSLSLSICRSLVFHRLALCALPAAQRHVSVLLDRSSDLHANQVLDLIDYDPEDILDLLVVDGGMQEASAEPQCAHNKKKEVEKQTYLK